MALSPLVLDNAEYHLSLSPTSPDAVHYSIGSQSLRNGNITSRSTKDAIKMKEACPQTLGIHKDCEFLPSGFIGMLLGNLYRIVSRSKIVT